MESDQRKGSRDLGADTIIYDCMYQIIICKQSKAVYLYNQCAHFLLLSQSLAGSHIRIKIHLKSEVKKKKGPKLLTNHFICEV